MLYQPNSSNNYSEDQYLLKFTNSIYEEIKELPMIRQFILDGSNQELFKKAYVTGDIEIIEKLNLAFKAFYKRQKGIKYAIGIIKRYSIDYDKRVKKRNNRYLLTLDKPINNNDESTRLSFLELLQDTQQAEFPGLQQTEIFEMEDERLREAVEKAKLNPFQKKLLKLIYKDNYSQREISKMVGQTEQNIYYWHKKTINQLRNEMDVIFRG